jgi:hypothetical protein
VALVLRKIRKSKWYKSGSVPWLEEGDLRADALSDLATKGNKLSVYWLMVTRIRPGSNSPGSYL